MEIINIPLGTFKFCGICGQHIKGPFYFMLHTHDRICESCANKNIQSQQIIQKEAYIQESILSPNTQYNVYCHNCKKQYILSTEQPVFLIYKAFYFKNYKTIKDGIYMTYCEKCVNESPEIFNISKNNYEKIFYKLLKEYSTLRTLHG